jgi:hypothetical protein
VASLAESLWCLSDAVRGHVIVVAGWILVFLHLGEFTPKKNQAESCVQ